MFPQWQSEADADISIRGPGFFRGKINRISKQFVIKKNQKIPRSNSMRKLQDIVKRKMPRTKLEIFY
jgi:hypothetical protein